MTAHRILATHRITAVPLHGWDDEFARFLRLRKQPKPTPFTQRKKNA